MGFSTTIMPPPTPSLAEQAVEIRDRGREFLLEYAETGPNAPFYRSTQLWVNEAAQFIQRHGVDLDLAHPGLVDEIGNVIDGVQNARQGFDVTKGGWFQKAFEAFNSTTLGRELTTQAIRVGDAVDPTKEGSLGRKIVIGIAVLAGVTILAQIATIVRR